MLFLAMQLQAMCCPSARDVCSLMPVPTNRLPHKTVVWGAAPTLVAHLQGKGAGCQLVCSGAGDPLV